MMLRTFLNQVEQYNSRAGAGWFAIVLPSLALNYFGQGALLITNPSAIDNPFYQLAPDWAHYPLVLFATLATIIASQAIISGAYSLTQQAMQLDFLPRMQVKHTASSSIGQIYMFRAVLYHKMRAAMRAAQAAP